MPIKKPATPQYRQQFPSGVAERPQPHQRDPSCFLAPGYTAEALGGAEVVAKAASILASTELTPDTAPGWLDSASLGGSDVPTEMLLGGTARQALIKAKRDQAKRLMAEADALEAGLDLKDM